MDILIADRWLAMAGGGFLIGLLIGATGVGAGAVTTPMLISGFGVPPSVAVGTDLFFAAITKASSAWHHHRLRNVDWRVLKDLAAGSLPGAAVTLAWFHFVGSGSNGLVEIIRPALAVALVFSAAAIALRPLLGRQSMDSAPVDSGRRRVVTILVGGLLGALVAVTSVGAGAIGVVVLTILYPDLIARRLIGTDIVHAVPLTLAAGMGHLGTGGIDLAILATLLAGSVPGVAIGSRMTGLLPDSAVRIALALVLVGAAVVLILE